MSKKIICCICAEDVEKISSALCKKILGRNIKRFFCLNCLSDYLDTPVDELMEMAEDFKKQGCTLFD